MVRIVSYNFIEFMVLTEEGIFGVPLRVSATFVFLFILFGAFLKYGRLGEIYNDLALSIAGGLRGGPAKVAVISSGLFGTISGSATANVSTSGTFTIPMMVNNGYSPRSAGAIEALASTGSQLVPPIMGAAAFIMAELTGISYWHIATAAIIPSILYYFAVYLAIHYEAIDMALEPYQGRKTTLLDFVLKKTYMFILIFVIIFFLATGHTIILSAMLAIVSCFLIGVVTILFSRKLYVIPFLFVTYPSLLLGGSGYRIVFESLKAGTILLWLCSVYMGRFRRKLSWFEKLLFMIAVVCLWAGQKWGASNAVGLLCFGMAAWYNVRLNRAAEN